jgi:hypothetical protein
MVARTGAVELLGAGLRALAHADAAQLEALVDAARGARMPQTVKERQLVQERLRALGYLIALTQRNLRLLRGAERDGPFGNRRDAGAWEH